MWRKYSVEFKMEVIEVWKEHKLTMAEIMSKYKISDQTVQRWVKEYDCQGIDGLVTKITKMNYTGEFKQKVVEDMKENGLNQSETARKYSVGRTQVQQWNVFTLRKDQKHYIPKIVVELLNQLIQKRILTLTKVLKLI